MPDETLILSEGILYTISPTTPKRRLDLDPVVAKEAGSPSTNTHDLDPDWGVSLESDSDEYFAPFHYHVIRPRLRQMSKTFLVILYRNSMRECPPLIPPLPTDTTTLQPQRSSSSARYKPEDGWYPRLTGSVQKQIDEQSYDTTPSVNEYWKKMDLYGSIPMTPEERSVATLEYKAWNQTIVMELVPVIRDTKA